MSTSLFSNTPSVIVLDNRGLTVRDLAYHRHPDTPEVTSERITRHRYDARGFLTQSADPRLHDAGLANFSYRTDLAGSVLRLQSVDSGTIITLNDAAGRPFIAVSNISTAGDGTEDRSQAVTRTWQYENASLPGRPLSITEQVTGEAARITERFVYAGNTAEEKALNLAGACVSHYDTAGLAQTDSVALTGVPLSVTRRLLKDADNPDVAADWQGTDASVWNDLLDGEAYTALTTADATGAVLTTTDAKGNLQRVAYDVAGLLSGSWLTLKGGKEQTIVASLAYSAAGQKLRELHGNGVVTTYTYEAETQRLTGIKTERPAGHASGARVLQDLRYGYDPVGNVLSVRNDAEETRFWRNQKVVPESTYAYDSLYQLARATGREMANAGKQGSSSPAATVPLPADGSAYTNYTRTYSYDSAGNLTQIRHSAPTTNNTYTTNVTISDRSNRGVLSPLTEKPAEVDALFTASGQQTQLLPGQYLTWTPRNELLKVTPVVRDRSTDDSESYRYDGGSQRILKVRAQKTGNSMQMQRVVYLPELELRTTSAGDKETENLHAITIGEAGRAQVRMLHWESGRPAEITGDQLRYSYDNLTGSSGLELDGDGNIISMEEYYPYGGTAVWTARSAVEADYKTVRYSGKERDATGLYYYGYRYYQPWAGRWLSADPAGTVDGLNLFRMVRNNPGTLRDPLGLASDDEHLIDKSYKRMSTGEHWQRYKSYTNRAFDNKKNFDKVVKSIGESEKNKLRTVLSSPEGSGFYNYFNSLPVTLLHFTNIDLDINNEVRLLSRKQLKKNKVKFNKENTSSQDIKNLSTDDFVFTSLMLGENGKSKSRFGSIRYAMNLSSLSDNKYVINGHLAMNDTLCYSNRVPNDDYKSGAIKRLRETFSRKDTDALVNEVLADHAIETVFSYDDFMERLSYKMLNTAFNLNTLSTSGRNEILSINSSEGADHMLSLLFRPQFLIPVKLTTNHFTKGYSFSGRMFTEHK
ncbi:RHS repeat protein (plasmid) [Serratia liquefaciens]|uniref:RHS repeat protein n=1 Tax=Serratia liquefaciens TaxID=614 RepID=A0A515D5L3_SERLI|nr:RHS repeat protein [Serratia liquefaciens]